MKPERYPYVQVKTDPETAKALDAEIEDYNDRPDPLDPINRGRTQEALQ